MAGKSIYTTIVQLYTEGYLVKVDLGKLILII